MRELDELIIGWWRKAKCLNLPETLFEVMLLFTLRYVIMCVSLKSEETATFLKIIWDLLEANPV